MKFSTRGMVSPFIAMDVLAAANRRQATGAPVYHLEVGQPSAPPPPAVNAAAKAAIDAGQTGYTEGLGAAPLRARIARHYGEYYGIDLSPERIVVTTGSSAGFLLAFLALFDAGDRVALPRPGYPAYRNILKALDLEPVDITPGDDFRLTAAAIDRAWHERGPFSGLLVASPNNPTGTIIGAAGLADIAALCRSRGIQLIADEIYHGITYGAPAPTALAADADAIIINSFSKYYCMTGWRVGWMVIPQALQRVAECLSQNFFVCAPSPAQHAALAAFDDRPALDALVAGYGVNRRLLQEALAQGGIGRTAPADGAFYIYADIADTGLDAPALCHRLLHDTGVAITPGIDFDPVAGGRFVRLSYAGAPAMIAEAAARLSAWLQRL